MLCLQTPASCPSGHSFVRVSSCDLMRSISLSMAGMAFTVKGRYTPIKAQGPISQVKELADRAFHSESPSARFTSKRAAAEDRHPL